MDHFQTVGYLKEVYVKSFGGQKGGSSEPPRTPPPPAYVRACNDKQMIEDALKGKNRKLLVKPDMCPLEVYKIMLECWAHDLEQRATFEKLFQLLTSIHNNV